MSADEEDEELPDLASALPWLSDDMFLGMQANNLGLVDKMIEDMERQLLLEYIELEHTPRATFDRVSALNRLWGLL